MTPILNSWTFDKIKEAAVKYGSRREFELKNNSAYQAAVRTGVLDLVCTHMKSPRGTSLPEKELLSEIKNIYPNAKKFKDTRVTIEGSPLIKGFEIDIRLGNRGIEFDGKYWHSLKAIRKGRNRENWPELDLINYHAIKDGYFSSIGIQILHIKEEEWDSDRQACIQRCVDFLGGPNE
jgi:hypothetical protein